MTRRAQGGRRLTWRRGAAAAGILLGVFALASWLLVPYRILGPSMAPALEGGSAAGPGDLVLVNRAAYLLRPPGRGDIVVRWPPAGAGGLTEFSFASSAGGEGEGVEPSPAETVKRVAGLPGETIEIRDGGLLVDGVRTEIPGAPRDGSIVEKGPFGHGPVRLGPGEYFLLGDSSYLSRDSRQWGPARHSEIGGRVVFILLPWSRMGPAR